MKLKPYKQGKQRNGAMMVLIVLLLPVILLLAAFVISLAHVELSTTELHAASDAAARAGGRTLIVTGDQGQAANVARQFAELNEVANEPLTLGSGDIVFGRSIRPGSGARYNFSPGGNPNSVRVTGRRTDSSPDGPVQTLLSAFLPTTSINVERVSTSTQVEIDLALCIDKSGSMAYAANERAAFPPAPRAAPTDWEFCDPVPPNSRWLDVVGAVNIFAQRLNSSPIDSRLAIVTYSDGATIDRALSTDILGAPSSLNRYSNSFCSGLTNIGAGLGASGNALSGGAPGSRPTAIKVVVVLTDGIKNAGPNPVGVAGSLANDGGLIFSITFSNEADRSLMESVADRGNGAAFHANNAADLEAAFIEIVKRLPTLITE